MCAGDRMFVMVRNICRLDGANTLKYHGECLQHDTPPGHFILTNQQGAATAIVKDTVHQG